MTCRRAEVFVVRRVYNIKINYAPLDDSHAGSCAAHASYKGTREAVRPLYKKGHQDTKTWDSQSCLPYEDENLGTGSKEIKFMLVHSPLNPIKVWSSRRMDRWTDQIPACLPACLSYFDR